MKVSKIYILVDPFNGACRYVGKTYRSLSIRLNEHIKESKKLKNHRHFWINSLLKKNELPIILEIDEIVPGDNWEFWEMYWIEQFKVWGFKLTNGDAGGRGLHNPTKETRKNISLSKMGEKNPNYGKIASSETKRKMSECRVGDKNSNYGNKWSEENKNNFGKKREGIKNPFFGKNHSIESILKTSSPIVVIDKGGKVDGKNGKPDLYTNYKGNPFNLPVQDADLFYTDPINSLKSAFVIAAPDFDFEKDFFLPKIIK